jgi:phosphatidylglycerol:prolipoprotein diacylglycerol transferase
LTAGLITSDASKSLPVHPTQLYEAVFGLTLFLVLASRLGRRLPGGLALFAYFAAYSLFRFVVEFLRGDDRGLLLGFSVPQVFSIGLLILGLGSVAFVARAARRVRALKFG